MENKDKNKAQQINIELPEELASGTYANLVIVSHSQAEFVLDFTRILPGLPKAKVQSRILMTPLHAKKFAQALHDNISKFESQNGEIKTGNNPNDNLGFAPGSPKIN
ncbi:DUF3467 domain-containing protein [Candidatus Kapabacteria bacterium]|nr:DUF3467 domain-containing protein [Candidatus Kapabacteria bacterium]